MKKIKIISVVALFSLISITTHLNQNTPKINLGMENIEALARGEISDECEGCVQSLYFCRFYGDTAGCLGTAIYHEI